MAKLPDPYSAARPVPRFGGVDQANPVVVGGDVAVGQAVSNVGSQVMRFALREQAKADQAMLDSKTTEYKRRLLDLQREAYSVKGKDVAENDRYMPDFEDRHALLVQEVLGETKNPRVHQLLQGRLELGEVNFKEGLIKHITQETEVYQADALNAKIEIAIDTGAATPYDDSVVDQQRDDIRVGIANYGQSRGWAKEVVENKTRQALSKMHTEIISQMLDDGNVAEAEAHFAHVTDDRNSDVMKGGEIEGEAYDNIQAAIKKSGDIVRSQDAVDDYIGRGLTRAEAKKEARENYTGALRDDIVNRIEARFNEMENAKNLAKSDAFDGQLLRYEQLREEGLSAMEAWDRLSNTALDTMGGTYFNRLRDIRDADINGEASVTTDIATYLYLERFIRENPVAAKRELGQGQLASYRGSISTTHLMELQDLINKDPKMLGTETEILKEAMVSAGIDPKDQYDPDSDDGKKARAFKNWIRMRLPPDYTKQDLLGLTNQAVVKVITDPGMFWNSTEYAYEAGTKFNVPGVSKEVVPALGAALTTLAMPVTIQNLQYAAALRAAGDPITRAGIEALIADDMSDRAAAIEETIPTYENFERDFPGRRDTSEMEGMTIRGNADQGQLREEWNDYVRRKYGEGAVVE